MIAKTSLIDRAASKGAKITPQREVICRTLELSCDHPTADELWKRARKLDQKVSVSAVYRTLRILEDLDLIRRHDFGEGRARYEVKRSGHHDHLIDVQTGKVIEFQDPELEALKTRIAERLGYSLEHHSLELYGRPMNRPAHAQGEV
ncbi:MAG: transcriptional repressor [Pseudomonadota bacterium]